MASLEAVLSQFGRPREESVARVILMMAASLSSSSEISPAEIPTVFQLFCLFTVEGVTALKQPTSSAAIDPNDWNPETFVHVVQVVAASSGTPLDWLAVIRGFDVEELASLLSTRQSAYHVILSAYGAATGRPVLPGEAVVGQWKHSSAQLALLTCALTNPGSVSWESVTPTVDISVGDPVSPFRCVPLIEALINLDARPLLQAALAASPDVVLLALASSKPQKNVALQQQLLVTLLASRLATYPQTSEVVKHVRCVNRPVVDAGILSMWTSGPESLPLLLEIIQDLKALPEMLSSASMLPVEFNLDLAILAFRREHLNLDKWMTERLAEGSPKFMTSCVAYLSDALESPGHSIAKSLPLEAVAIIFKCLFGAPLNLMSSQSEVAEALVELRRVYEVFLQLNPRLSDLAAGWDGSNKDITVGSTNISANSSSVTNLSAGSTPSGHQNAQVGSSALDEPMVYPSEVEEEATTHYKGLYQGHISVEQTVDLLRQLQMSTTPHSQQVFSCMIHTLFDEYRFLNNYPDRQLRTTGMLFGALAQYSILSGSELGVLLNHILTALRSIERSPSPVGRLAKFGICALERCLPRLHEFPMFCRCVLSVSRLREVVPELMSRVQAALERGSTGLGSSEPSAAERDVLAPWIGGSGVSTIDGVPPARSEHLVSTGGPAVIAVGTAASGTSIPVASLRSDVPHRDSEASSTAAALEGVEQDGGSDSGTLGAIFRSGVIPAGSLRGPSLPERSTALGLSPSVASGLTPTKTGALRPSPSAEGGFQFSSVNMDTLLSGQQKSMDVPPTDIQDKIHFIFNNLSATNLETKEKEIMQFLEHHHVDFVAHYVVVKRASIEPNHHDMYISFLDRISVQLRGLMPKILDRSYENVRILLNSEKIVSSSSERLLLKSLGSWIGSLTIARNKPILRRDLDLKELLLDAYSNGRLIAVVPFVSKVLITARLSRIFKPTNPWLGAILRLLKEIYVVPDLKLNVKFELPLLTKALGVEANDIQQSDLLRTRAAPVRDGNPDFTAIKRDAGMASPVRSPSPSSSPTRGHQGGFVASSLSYDTGAAAGGVPIFSLDAMPTTGINNSIASAIANRDLLSAMDAGVRVRASLPGSDAVGDLSTILATATLSSGGMGAAGLVAQQQAGSFHRHSGGGNGNAAIGTTGGGNAAAVAAAAAAAQQAAAAAAAAAAASEASVISSLAQLVTIPSSLTLFQTSPQLKRFVPLAIDRAVQEIIQPVAERSCAIATITTRELALKDFAHEMDSAKVQKAARQMVQQLAGSLALVTCKEPLRVSMSNQLRPLLSSASGADPNVLEQALQMLCSSNLELGCAIIERAATEKAARDINEVIAPLFSARRQQQQQNHGLGGLSAPSAAQDVLRVYDDFGRISRPVPPVTGSATGPVAVPAGALYSASANVQASVASGAGGPNSGLNHTSGGFASSNLSGNAVAATHPAPPIPNIQSAPLSSTRGRSAGYGASRVAPGAAVTVVPAALVAGQNSNSIAAADIFQHPTAVVNGASFRPVAALHATIMASPSAMAEAMRVAAAQGPSSGAAMAAPSSSVASVAGEDKPSTQQVLERFNTLYPQLTAAIVLTVESASRPIANGSDKDVSLSELPADHEVQQYRMQIAQAVKKSLTADEASMAVAQKVFRRLYEGQSNLHREVHVALLESMRECSRRLSKELVSWLAYSEDAKKLNRECIVALLRPGSLLHITSYDELVAKTCDNGRNVAALDFAAFLVRRAIIEEPLTTTRELYLTLELLTKVGRRAAAPTLPSAPNGLIALVESSRQVVHRPAPAVASGSVGVIGFGGGSAGSSGCASADGHLLAAARAARAIYEAEAMDPPGSRETVASVLTEWQRMLASGSSSRPVSEPQIASFVTQAKPTTLFNEEARDRFLRIGIDLVCSATTNGLQARSGAVGFVSPIVNAPYTPVESMVRFVSALCKTETSGESTAKGISMLSAYLTSLVRYIVKASHNGDVRPHFRLFSGILAELSIGVPPLEAGDNSLGSGQDRENSPPPASSPAGDQSSAMWNGLEPSYPGRSTDGGFAGGLGATPSGVEGLVCTANIQVLSAVGNALNSCNPNLAPGFSYAWLELVSNHDVMSRLLAFKSGKGWSIFRQLLVSMLTFLSPHLGRVSSMTELSEGVRTLYRGTLRVLLVLLHDFPDFLCDYHFALCDAIPPNCVQMRNLVLSAYPPSMRLPDPFMPNLKVDKLLEMASEPRVLSNFTTALVSSGLKGIVDKYLQDASPRGGRQVEALGLSNRLLSKDSDAHSRSYNTGAVNALVLYLGQQSISRSSPDGQPIINGPCTEILQGLVSELDAEGRYHVFNAIANQLRYPNKHTHYFSCVLLFLFRDSVSEEVKEQITRVLVERLIANRPHPWGLLITFIELIKNPSYNFWSHDFVRCAPQIERLFENVARFCSGGGMASGGSGDGSTLTDDVSAGNRPVPFAS